MAIAQGAGAGGGSDSLANILAGSKKSSSSSSSFKKTLEEYKSWYRGDSSFKTNARSVTSKSTSSNVSDGRYTGAIPTRDNKYSPSVAALTGANNMPTTARKSSSPKSTSTQRQAPAQQQQGSGRSDWRGNAQRQSSAGSPSGNMGDNRTTYSNYNLPSPDVMPRQPWEGQDQWGTRRGSFTNAADYRELWSPGVSTAQFTELTPQAWAEQKIWEAKRRQFSEGGYTMQRQPTQPMPMQVPPPSQIDPMRMGRSAQMVDTIAPAPLPASRSGDPRASIYSQTPGPMVYNSVYLPIAPMNPMQFGMPEDPMQARFRRWR